MTKQQPVIFFYSVYYLNIDRLWLLLVSNSHFHLLVQYIGSKCFVLTNLLVFGFIQCCCISVTSLLWHQLHVAMSLKCSTGENRRVVGLCLKSLNQSSSSFFLKAQRSPSPLYSLDQSNLWVSNHVQTHFHFLCFLDANFSNSHSWFGVFIKPFECELFFTLPKVKVLTITDIWFFYLLCRWLHFLVLCCLLTKNGLVFCSLKRLNAFNPGFSSPHF